MISHFTGLDKIFQHGVTLPSKSSVQHFYKKVFIK